MGGSMKIKGLVLGLVAFATIGMVGCSSKEDKSDNLKVTLVLSEGGVNDQSFNQSAWEGALKAKENLDIDVSYLESKQVSDYTTNIENAIDQDSDLIIGVGFQLGDAIKEASENYPDQKFAIVDNTYDEIPSNLTPILFDEKQAGYSVGVVASELSKTKTVGFVGGMDIPSCSNFLVGFEKAIKDEGKDIKVLSQYANSFTDASKGKAISQQMISEGADILFMAGGGVNNGVLEVAREQGKKVIGVDMPSHHLAPDTVITSALKNVGTGVELTIKALKQDALVGGEPIYYNISNKGVGFEKTYHLHPELVEYVENKVEKYDSKVD